MFKQHSICAVQVALFFCVSTAAVKQKKEAASQENTDGELTWDFVVGEDCDEWFGYLEIFQIINESYHAGSRVSLPPIGRQEKHTVIMCDESRLIWCTAAVHCQWALTGDCMGWIPVNAITDTTAVAVHELF